MKTKLFKKAGYLIASVGLGTVLLLGSAYAKKDNPTEINITARIGHHLFEENVSHQQNKQFYIYITAHDEDGIKDHYAFVESQKIPYNTIYTHGVGKKSKDEKSSIIDLQLYWPMKDELKVNVFVEDKDGNKTTKTLDFYVK